MVVLKIFAALFLALIATLGGYYVYADHRAEGAANQFCNAVVMGSAASSIAEKVQAAGGRYLSSSNSNLYKVFFQGPPFNGFYCDLTVRDGKVESRQVTRVQD